MLVERGTEDEVVRVVSGSLAGRQKHRCHGGSAIRKFSPIIFRPRASKYIMRLCGAGMKAARFPCGRALDEIRDILGQTHQIHDSYAWVYFECSLVIREKPRQLITAL